MRKIPAGFFVTTILLLAVSFLAGAPAQAASGAEVSANIDKETIQRALSWGGRVADWGEGEILDGESARKHWEGMEEIVWSGGNASVGEAAAEFAPEEGLGKVAYSPDGDSFLVISGNRVGVFSSSTGEEVTTLIHGQRVVRALYSPDSESILIVEVGGMASLWNTDTVEASEVVDFGWGVTSVAFSPASSFVAVGHVDGSVDIWNITEGLLVKDGSLAVKVGGSVEALAVSPDSKKLLIGAGPVAELWDVGSDGKATSIGHPSNIVSVGFSSESGRVVTASSGEVIVTGVAEAKAIRLEGFTNITSVSISPNGLLVAVTTSDGKVEIKTIRPGDYDSKIALIEGMSKESDSFELVSDVVSHYFEAGVKELQQLPAELDEELAALQAKEFAAPTLVKGEFEKSSDFEARKAKAQSEYDAKIAAHNLEVLNLNVRITEHLQKNSKLPGWDFNRIVESAFHEVFGRPVLENVRYDADTETFFVDLFSDSKYASSFKRTVAVAGIPPEKAREVKAQLQEATASVVFGIDEGNISWKNCSLIAASGAYSAIPTDADYEAVDVVAKMSTERQASELDLESLKVKTGTEGVSVGFDENPEILALRKKLNERQKRIRQAEAEKAEIAKLRAQFASLEDRDDSSNMTALGKKILSGLPEGESNPNGIAVIIGNKNYRKANYLGDVLYAHNDADALRQYAIRTLGYDERKVFVLSDVDKAGFESWFGNKHNPNGMLKDKVRPGESDVLVFYSGHGVPGLSDGKGYLMPVNANPKKIELTGYPLEILYANIEEIEAKSITVIVEACFSGGSGSGESTQKEMSGPLLKIIDPRLEMPGAVVITASATDEVANWDTDAKFGILTRQFIEGVSGKADGDKDGRVLASELQNYLSEEVTYRAKYLHGRTQTPQVTGPQNAVIADIN